MKFDIQIYSDIGKRNENQDSLSFKQLNDEILVACIADGVGGKFSGAKASSMSVNYFIENNLNIKNNLKNIILEIHQKIISEANNDIDKGMATTFTGIRIYDNKIYGIHTGDTRVCILRGNGIKQLTEDHTEVARLVREGKLTFKESLKYPRRNIIESALGIEDRDPIIFEFEFEIQKGDRIILTTDGVHETIRKRDFRDISTKSKTSEEFLETLVTLLERKEPNDNNSIIVITILE